MLRRLIASARGHGTRDEAGAAPPGMQGLEVCDNGLVTAIFEQPALRGGGDDGATRGRLADQLVELAGRFQS